MDIFILIPYRNRRANLLTLITQIKRNLRFYSGNIEVIIVDLGSSSNLHTELSAFPFVSYHYVEYKGTFSKSWALNIAFRKSVYPWIFILDVDCIFLVKFFQSIGEKLDSSNFLNCYIFGGIRHLNDDLTWRIVENHTVTSKIQSEILAEYHSMRQALGYGNIILHRNLFMKVGGPDEKMIGWGREDSDFYYRLVLAKCETMTLPDEPQFALFHLEHDRADLAYNNRLFFYVNDFIEQYNRKNKIIHANPLDRWGDMERIPNQYDYEELIDFQLNSSPASLAASGKQLLQVNGISFDSPIDMGTGASLYGIQPDELTFPDPGQQYILLGGGLQYDAKALIKRTKKVIIIEKYRRIRELAMQWSGIDPVYFLDTDYRRITDFLIQIQGIKNKRILVHQPSLQLDKAWYQSVLDIIDG